MQETCRSRRTLSSLGVSSVEEGHNVAVSLWLHKPKRHPGVGQHAISDAAGEGSAKPECPRVVLTIGLGSGRAAPSATMNTGRHRREPTRSLQVVYGSRAMMPGVHGVAGGT